MKGKAMTSHGESCKTVWTGNTAEGTRSYCGQARTRAIAVPGKAVVQCSDDPLLGGAPGRMNPEDL